MPQECDIWDVLGHSVVLSDEDSHPRHQEVRRLKTVFGEFRLVRFHILRLGPEAFQLTIQFFARHGMGDTTETVAGLIGDTMVLPQGQQVTFVRYSQDSGKLFMRFWTK